ncbi:hypothetical protein BDW22DRAFT_1400509 [Trametopsis cervina]|nr:hypothetical protein BDW22DRAFT_1400509 [Trametopsis cervina]
MPTDSLPPANGKRTRYVSEQWIRPSNGPLLPQPPPKGVRTPNGIIWGHDLKDFFFIQRAPGVDVMAIWSRSMIKEYGENYDEKHFQEPDVLQIPRRRHPWPLLKYTDDYEAKADTAVTSIGIIDQGCIDHSNPKYAPEWRDTNTSKADKRFKALAKRLLGWEDDGSLMRNDPRAPVKAPDGRTYTILWAPHVRKSLKFMQQSTTADTSKVSQTMQVAPFTTIEIDPVGIHVLTALDDDALEELGGPSLPPSFYTKKATSGPSQPSLSSEASGSGSSSMSKGATAATHGDATSETATTSNNANPEVQRSPKATDIGPAKDANKDKPKAPATSDILSAKEAIPKDSPFSIKKIPKLEEMIPAEHFPDILYVHDPHSVTLATVDTYMSRPPSDWAPPMKYKREYPKFPHDTEPGGATEAPRVGHLYLAQQNRFGVGHHSLVHHAPLTLPDPLTAQSRNGNVIVAAKTAFARSSARDLLKQEAEIYNLFPQHLMEDWCGYNLVTPIKHPVPVAPVVPKLYGYYVPMDVPDWETNPTTSPSPILLIEECGEPVQPFHFTVDDRTECYAMMRRLHYAGFIQGSFYTRNILTQPGPLTVPPEKRSNKTPSFRVIDFGRGLEFNRYINDPDEEGDREAKKRRWDNSLNFEDEGAIKELIIDYMTH